MTNIVVLPGAARRPDGDLILCDVAREEASVVLEDLRDIGISKRGSITLETLDTYVSDAADRAVAAAEGSPADVVIWEEIEERTAESATLSFSFLVFIVIAALIAAVGIYLDSTIFIVGAMVVGPEFGPIAGFCVAIIQPPRALAARAFLALAVGFPVAIMAVFWTTTIFKATGVTPEVFTQENHTLSAVIASPDFLSFFVAFCAGIAGMLSLSTAKSGALIGVLISVTTIPAAANVGVSAHMRTGRRSAARSRSSPSTSPRSSPPARSRSPSSAVYKRRRERHITEELDVASGEHADSRPRHG